MGAADPGLCALKNALRAAVVVPLAFALALEGLDNKQMALFAAFGSVALLVFVDFGGPRRARLRAYLLLFAAGCLLIALGTLCSRSPWLATASMALVGFAILFAGVLDGYVAAAQSAALLTFVLPVMVPAGTGAIPDRLAGWGIGAALSIPAVLLVWPARPRGVLRRQAATAVRSLAALARSGEPGERERARGEALGQARALRRSSVSVQHRPSGTGREAVALGRLIEGLGWLCAIAAHPRPAGERRTPWEQTGRRVELAVPRALDAAGDLLALGEGTSAGGTRAREAEGAVREELEELREAHARLGHQMIARFEGWRAGAQEREATAELDEAFRLRQLAFGGMQIVRHALVACGAVLPGESTRHGGRLGATGRLARTHATMRSVWLRNSVRGAAGLAVAVLVGQLSDLQHSFWIVLGTMSVLRSNALATGATVVQALLGTLAGIVAGGLLVLAVGTHHAALWAVLPVAVGLAAYAPRAISFAAGQAAFSLTVLVLFNLIVPEGWKVGLVRLEDVAVGAAVSLLAGALIWPRGASSVVRRAYAAAYDRAALYLAATIESLAGAGGSPQAAAREADASAQLLDETIHDYASERSSAHMSLDDLCVLIAGAGRMRRVARALAGAQGFARLAPVDGHLHRLALAWSAFEDERRECCEWYAALGSAIAGAARAPAPHGPPESAGPAGRVVLERDGDGSRVPPGVAIAWAHRHLATLIEFEPALAQAGSRVGRELTRPASA